MTFSAAEVQRRLSYCQDTGVLRWKADPPRGRVVGDVAPTRDNGSGYLYLTFNRRPLAVHRAAWAVATGRWPVEIDHIDGDKSNNILANLREADRSTNEANKRRRSDNTSGYKGVGWHKCRGAWRAYIQVRGKQISLGYFPTPEDAHAAYVKAAQEHFGLFARAA